MSPSEVKVGWSVRVKVNPESRLSRHDITGQVSQVDPYGRWFRMGQMDVSYLVPFADVDDFHILDTTYEIVGERVAKTRQNPIWEC